MKKEREFIRALDGFTDAAKKFATVPDPPLTIEDNLFYWLYGAACWYYGLHVVEMIIDS